MDYITTYVGMDVHKASIAVAIAEEGHGEPISLGMIPNNHDSLLKLLKKLQKPGRQLSFCYESGPCGYEIYRFLAERGLSCIVAATSLIPTKAGDKVKTDKRDAKKLARLFRSGELTPVWVPDEAQEALRDRKRKIIPTSIKKWASAPLLYQPSWRDMFPAGCLTMEVVCL